MTKKKNNRKTNNLARNTQKLLHDVCSVTDPFCPAAQTAKWGGLGSRHTQTVQLVMYEKIVTDANGEAHVYFTPNVGKYQYKAQSKRSFDHSLDEPTAEHAAWSAFLDSGAVEGARVVSAGATWWNATAGTASGGVQVAQSLEASSEAEMKTLLNGDYDPLTPPVNGSPSLVGDLRDGGAWVSKGAYKDSYEMHDPWMTAGNITSDEYRTHFRRTALLLGFSGPASSTVAIVKFVINIEYNERLATLGHAASNRADVPASESVQQIASLVERKAPSFYNGVKSVMPTIKQAAVWAAKKTFSAGLGVAGAYFGGPNAGYAAASGSALIMDAPYGYAPNID